MRQTVKIFDLKTTQLIFNFIKGPTIRGSSLNLKTTQLIFNTRGKEMT